MYGKSIITKRIRLNKAERNAINLPDNIKEVLVGIMLSDGHLARRSITGNARFIFSQSGKENTRPYFYLVYGMFKIYCAKDSKYYAKAWKDKKTNQEYSSVTFTTMQLPCFTELHSLWYLNKRKIVPKNIKDILTPIGLAYWIMGDGFRHNLGLHLSVYAFSPNEIELLINTLETKFLLKCSIHKHSTIGGKPRIYIWKESMDKLRLLVTPYIIPSMRYKIHL
jgi:LAGLIDADG DNA endonuclease family